MTLRHMKVFVAVYQTENVTRAAKQLNLTQPVVTRTIQEIEKYYGVCLFERINHRLHTTEAGREFYSYALHIIDSFDQLEKGLRNWDELGVIRVGATSTLGNALLPGILKEFRREHPALQVRARISNGSRLQQALVDNRLDFALIEGEIQDESLCVQPIAQDRLVLILPPEDPRRNCENLEIRDLAADPLILREEGSMGRTLVDRVFATHNLPVVPIIESVSTQAIVRAVHEGLGISFLPENLVRQDIDSGYVATREIRDETFSRENFIVWHKHKYLTGAARKLMALAQRGSYRLPGREASED